MSDQARDERRIPVFVDIDLGCDDAVAIAWLLARPTARVVGFSTVFGSSSVQNTTANLLTLLEALGHEVPVTIGAAAPLVYPRTATGALLHGQDGFWGAQMGHRLIDLPQGAPGAIAAAARAYPDLTILALGPLTNIARAAQAYPDELSGIRLVALSGTWVGGNISPVAEFNAFADPHALSVVLESGMCVELVTLDAAEMLQVDSASTVTRLAQECGPVGRLLARLVSGYAQALTRGQGGKVALPGVVAALYMLLPALGSAADATVRVVSEGELTRGQTVIAASLDHRIALGLGAAGLGRLADQTGLPDFDLQSAMSDALARAPHNAQVVLRVDSEAMHDILVEGLMAVGVERALGK